MAHTLYSTEGIVLRVIPFRDNDKIISLFTPDRGLIKILHKGGRSKRQSGAGPCMPLTKVEVVFWEKRGEIFGCEELNAIYSYSELRRDLSSLEAGCDLLQVILDSQFVGKEAPHLYALLCYYLGKIAQTNNPWVLAASFRLKLLKHEGLVRYPLICAECGTVLIEEGFTNRAESWCGKHRPIESLLLRESELQALYCLAESQSYVEISSVALSPQLKEKIFTFFRGHF